ncbi:MAG: LexA family protein [Candidatus Berkiella sp.]
MTQQKTSTRKNKWQTLPRGGKRDGAGRPHGSGKYGEPTRAIRVPQSLVEDLQQFLIAYGQKDYVMPPNALPAALMPKNNAVPLYGHKIAAGFPSPADDHHDAPLDLNEHLIKNPATTFFVRVEGDSMINAGIFPNDMLVVDLSIEPQDSNVVIAFLNGEFTVKRLKIAKNQQITLLPENENYAPIVIKEEMDFRLWGVVTSVIHSL